MNVAIHIGFILEIIFVSLFIGNIVYFFGKLVFNYIRQRLYEREYNKRRQPSRRELYFKEMKEKEKSISNKIHKSDKVKKDHKIVIS